MKIMIAVLVTSWLSLIGVAAYGYTTSSPGKESVYPPLSTSNVEALKDFGYGGRTRRL
jgi:hypothetical protein